MVAGTKYLANVATVDEVEALAALEGLRIAVEIGLAPI